MQECPLLDYANNELSNFFCFCCLQSSIKPVLIHCMVSQCHLVSRQGSARANLSKYTVITVESIQLKLHLETHSLQLKTNCIIIIINNRFCSPSYPDDVLAGGDWQTH